MKEHKFINKKSLTVLFSIPFFCICPLVISSIFTGYPYAVWQNNDRLKGYQNLFERISLPEKTFKIGDTFSKIGGFDFDNGNCDFISSKVLVSELNETDLGQFLSDSRSAIFGENPSIVKNFQDTYEAKLFILPVNLNETTFKNDFFELDYEKDFNITNKSSWTKDKVYIFYMINSNLFESTDARCSISDEAISEIREIQKKRQEELERQKELERLKELEEQEQDVNTENDPKLEEIEGRINELLIELENMQYKRLSS